MDNGVLAFDYAAMRRLFLKVFIGFLTLTALVAIVAVLSGSFGNTQIKVLVTCLVITAGSICAMSCAAYMERQGVREVGLLGILTAVVAVALVSIGAWGEIKDATFWKTAAISGVMAAAVAHGCLLRLPELAKDYRWTQVVAAVLIGLLALQATIAIWGEVNDQGFYRAMAALSVLVVLASLVVPICKKLGPAAPESCGMMSHSSDQTDELPDRLALNKVSPGVYFDESGRQYHVREIRNE